ncbi:distal tail protein Dit [Aminipila luticellarii]|uniref:Siphovirus-type tail component RIFT-related domain-containing protein n=1 Tax=Aminipila luticellarii TaxID=2507160 RepID=A0A410PWX8_9FIRM|nr:distal tail protein Dit [Aminipila luticellarii]QAT43437.1 hypothetical protein EQM06_09540 [Aminipila luticellarii]
MIGLSFRNIHSSFFGIGVRSDDRSVIPELRKNEFTIPGKHGATDYGMNTYEKRTISVILGLMENANHEELRLKARDIAKWLSGQGMLIFDDEPDKAYEAGVYGYIGIEQIELVPAGILTVNFECQPFAESLEYRQVNTQLTASPAEVNTQVNGSIETCCIITIKNMGDTDIKDINIKRKAAI